MSDIDGELQPPPTRLLTGDEPITGTTGTVRDFWAWALSDLRTNTVRPMLAEFLVAEPRSLERAQQVVRHVAQPHHFGRPPQLHELGQAGQLQEGARPAVGQHPTGLFLEQRQDLGS